MTDEEWDTNYDRGLEIFALIREQLTGLDQNLASAVFTGLNDAVDNFEEDNYLD